MRKVIAAVAAAFALALGVAGAAGADPAFGPGNGQQNGDKCHPPGQTTAEPGCK